MQTHIRNMVGKINLLGDLGQKVGTRQKKNENKLDLKHLIFELIVLNAPKKRQHALDKQGNSTCNKEMVDLVKEYTQVKEKSSDPRWDALKNLK